MASNPRAGVRIDRKGIGRIMRENARPLVNEKAHAIADQIRAAHPDLADAVDVEEYTTDRGAASVMVKDGSARELQVREGLVTRAAAAVGLEVTEQ